MKAVIHDRRSPRGLNVAVWLVQLLLAAFFLGAGYAHGVQPLEVVAQQARWVADVPAALTRLIGFAEIAGALGVVLPAATGIMAWLTFVAWARTRARVDVLASGKRVARFRVSRFETSPEPGDAIRGRTVRKALR